MRNLANNYFRFFFQLWMMKGEIYEQEDKQDDARETFKQGVRGAVGGRRRINNEKEIGKENEKL